MSKRDRRARKKERKARHTEHCEQCGTKCPPGGDHNSVWSWNHWTWEGLAIVAWCPRCGWEYAS